MNDRLNKELIEEYWQGFLKEKGLPAETRYVDAYFFELTERWANELLKLVLDGVKRATASSLTGYELLGDPLPKKGDYSIVTDWEGTPKCVVMTTAVTILPFRDMTFEICSREGEDDNLESWQRGHRKFFTEEGKEVGYTFTEDMPVIFEDFEVVYR